MSAKLPLAARALLLAFIPVVIVLAAAFLIVNATIRAQLKAGVKQSMRATEQAVELGNAGFNRRTKRLLAATIENAGLKTAIGLLREVPYGQKSAPQVLKVVQDRVRQVAGTLDYDLLVVADPDGQPVMSLLGGGETGQEIPVDAAGVSMDLFPLIRLHDALYEGMAAPINWGRESLGSLILCRKFDIAAQNGSGYAALVRDHKILVSDFPESLGRDVERQLARRCSSADEDCEIEEGGEDFLTLRAQRGRFGDNLQLFTFQSVDAPMNGFLRRIRQDFLRIGAFGALMLLLFSALGSWSISKPLTDLIAHLNKSERTGRLRADFSRPSRVKEVNRLAEAFNRAAHHLEKAGLEFVETMAQALDARDAYTAGHSNRVSVNSTAIAEAMRLAPEQVQIIRIGAKLHDIGKIGIPDAVLQKPGPLTREEQALIQLHPQIGKKILEKAVQFQDYLPIVELHHEDYDGGGYPYGLKGDEIPLGVRIVHVADVYDALSSHRAYRRAMPEEAVIEILRQGCGTMFDPAVLEVFLEMLRRRKILERLLEPAGVIHVPS